MNLAATAEIQHCDAAVPTACASPRPIFLTVEQFASRNPAFSCSSLRNHIYKAEPRQSSRGEIPGNGLTEAGAIVRLGRRVLLDEGKFLAWVAQAGSAK